jgi:hypothetical protein
MFYTILAVLISFVAYKRFLYPASISPLSRMPNAHFLAPFTSLWIDWQRLHGQDFQQTQAAFAKYGKYVRLGPNEIAVNDIDGGLREAYGFGRTNLDKPSWYDIFKNYGYVLTHGILKVISYHSAAVISLMNAC